MSESLSFHDDDEDLFDDDNLNTSGMPNNSSNVSATSNNNSSRMSHDSAKAISSKASKTPPQRSNPQSSSSTTKQATSISPRIPGSAPSSAPQQKITSPPPPTTTATTTTTTIDEGSKFLLELGVLTKQIELQNQAEQLLYTILQDREPRIKTQILKDERIKVAGLKPKQIEDALIRLIERSIVSFLECDKVVCYFINADCIPQVNNPDDITRIKEKIDEYNKQMSRSRIDLAAVRSKKSTVQSQQTTAVLEQEVESLKEQIAKKQQRLELLRSLSKDPDYLNHLKIEFSKGIIEWRKRKAMAMDISQPYLETVSKKQRHFFKELGCEFEDSTESGGLGITLQDYMNYGTSKGLIDQHVRPLVNQSLVQLGTNNVMSPAAQQQAAISLGGGGQRPAQSQLMKGLVVGKGKTLAEALEERLQKVKETRPEGAVLSAILPTFKKKTDPPASASQKGKDGKASAKRPVGSNTASTQNKK